MALYDLLRDQDMLADLTDLHDDEEEDLVGADWHQDAIRIVDEGLLVAGPDRGLPWHVGNQLMVLVDMPNGKEWRPSPDISVHPTLGPTRLSSLDARMHGMPALIIEVTSERTYRYDLGAKRQAYERAGVREYLVFDPTHEWLKTAVIAWHATSHGFARWEPERDGRWHSALLHVAFEPQGVLLRVFDAEGVLQLHVSESTRRVAELEAEIRKLRGESI
jgi:Uma2 family endonuclease